MTAYRTEKEAILHMINRFGAGVFACVMDSYDYASALEKVLPSIASEKTKRGGYMVLRPDSGDQVQVVMMALRAADKIFGSDLNKKGFKIIRGCGVIQGDGVTAKSLAAILKAVKEAGYSAQNVCFGMGAGLLQKVNRDTMSFATKLSHIVYADGTKRDVMKTPKNDNEKISLPGEFVVIRNADGIPIVYPKDSDHLPTGENLLHVVYDHGKVTSWDDFDTVRQRAAKEWSALPAHFDVVSEELRSKVVKFSEEQKRNIELLQMG